jgi:uncharacterized protein (TIGR02646 family)
MISVVKGPRPQSLEEHEDEWNQQHVQAVEKWKQEGETGPRPSAKYNQKDIKMALERDFHKKCGFCESQYGAITYADIEHFLPKSIHYELAHTWKNLLLSCKKCNMSKRDNLTKIVNPCEIIDPRQLFSYDNELKGKIIISGLTPEAKNTISVCDLNRDDLVDKRAETTLMVRSAVKLSKLGDTDELDEYMSKIEYREYLGALRFFNLIV